MLVQTLVIAALVAWSAWFVARRLLPVTSRRVQAHLAGAIARSRAAPAWLRARAMRWQPKSTTGGSCGDGCSACGGCAAASVQLQTVEAEPLTLRRHKG